jgi:hypothetical protein
MLTSPDIRPTKDAVGEYNAKFPKLGTILPGDSSSYGQHHGEARWTSAHLVKAGQVEYWYRCAIAAREQIGETMSLGLLYAWLDFIGATNAQEDSWKSECSIKRFIHQSSTASIRIM